MMAANQPHPIRLVGIGSANGDDAIGWEVIRYLRRASVNLPSVEFFEVAGGQALLELLDGHGILIVIDAMTGGGPPGTVRRFDWPDAQFESAVPSSTHGLRTMETLRLAAVLGLLPPRVVTFGVEFAVVQPGTLLSTIALTAVAEAARWIEEELRDNSVTEKRMTCRP